MPFVSEVDPNMITFVLAMVCIGLTIMLIGVSHSLRHSRERERVYLNAITDFAKQTDEAFAARYNLHYIEDRVDVVETEYNLH